MKAVIIGGGAISELWHIPAAIKLLGRENVFVAETNRERCLYLNSKFELDHIGMEFQTVINSVDFAVIATPPHLHASIAGECLEAKLPVLCEKPLANSSKECESILDAATRTSTNIGVCHSYRYFPNRFLMRNRIKNELLGSRITIDICEGVIAQWPIQSGYTFRKNLVPGGVVLNNGIHSLDFMMWCLGKPVEIEYYDDSIGGLESNANIKIRFENDCFGYLRISRTCRLKNQILINGEKDKTFASLNIYEMNKMIDHDGIEHFVNDRKGKAVQDLSDVALLQMQDFIDAINGTGHLTCSGQEGAAVVSLIEQCYALKQSRPCPDSAPIPGLMW